MNIIVKGLLNIIVKMLKETDTEETIRLFCHIFIIGGISIGGREGAGPLAAPMNQNASQNLMTFSN